MSKRGNGLKVAIQIDPIETLNAASDTGLAIIEGAASRGHICECYAPESMARQSKSVTALCYSPAHDCESNIWRGGEKTRKKLEEFDVILVRQNPPYDMAYLTYAHMLRTIEDKTLILNDPAALCAFPEKISPLLFPHYMPPTLVSKDEGAIKTFAREHGSIVLKPLYNYGGSGVIKVDANDERAIENFLRLQSCPVMAQRFLPQVTEKGDRRIMLIDGDVAGSVVRVPQSGSFIANMVRGGKATHAPLSEKEENLCAELKPFLQKNGLFLAGIDVIDGCLTEINVTSPTGFRPIAALDNPKIVDMFWEKIERKFY
ncbi:MAG: glutathione synthase [Rickettsiales bacterium]